MHRFFLSFSFSSFLLQMKLGFDLLGLKVWTVFSKIRKICWRLQCVYV